MKIKGIIIVAIIVLFSLSACAPQQKEMEDIVFLFLEKGPVSYAPNLYIGMDKTCYIEANKAHSLQVFKSVTAYVPEHNLYYPRFDKLSEPIRGILEIMDTAGKVTKINPESFTYGVSKVSDPAEIVRNRRTDLPSYNSVYFGDAAERALEEYKQKMKVFTAERELYNKEVEIFNKKVQDANAKLEKLHEQFQKLREENKDTTAIEAKMDALLQSTKVAPQQPETPKEQLAELDYAYQIKLPKGDYTMLIRSDDGKIIEGSEKKLVVYTSTNDEAVGYQVIPYLIWESHFDSNNNHSVIYTNGKQDVIIRPYFQERYPSGMLNQVKDPQVINQLDEWRLTSYPDSYSLEISGQGKTEMNALTKMVPVDTQSSSGFSVIPEQEARDSGYQAIKGVDPIEGVIVKTKGGSGVYTVKLFTENNTQVSGSEREIHVVSKFDIFSLISISVGLGLLPLLIWFLLWIFVKNPNNRKENT